MDIIEILKDFGFPIACVIACGIFIYKLVTRNLDEAKEREKDLHGLIIANTSELSKIAETIDASNTVNKELSETNRMLVEKMEDKLTDIDNNVEKILDKIS